MSEQEWVDLIRKLFLYDPIAGTLTRRVSYGRAVAGTVLRASSKHRTPVSVAGHMKHHHIVCFIHHHGRFPRGLVDHRDRNIGNSAADNLREATHAQNQQNKAASNVNGKGVTWRNRKQNPWLAKIRVNGERINLGSFPTAELAAAAYREACLKYHGEFACLE